ncbi:MAG TPA: hypothetical protein VII96_11155 [Acidimicrobiales bacterium]
MGDTPDDPGQDTTDGDTAEDQPLSERFLDLFVFLPTGLIVTVAEELPKLAERGRARLGVQVNSARAVGHFAVKAGTTELKKRSEGLKRSSDAPSGGTAGGPTPSGSAAPTRKTPRTPAAGAPPRLRTIPYPPDRPAPGATPTAAPEGPTPAPVRKVDAHIPDVASLAIPGFDTLSASQVVQRLDGLSRTELVAVRAYETSTRGRRTILSRVDQLLDERS